MPFNNLLVYWLQDEQKGKQELSSSQYTDRQMKWAYLFLAIGAGVFTILAMAHPELPRRKEGIRICVTACVVNGIIFGAMHWAQKRQKEGRSRPPENINARDVT